MRILITGATGLIGSKLAIKLLELGYEVAYLTTSSKKIGKLNGCDGFYWNPAVNEVDVACLQNVSIIFNLAGSSINGSWSKAGKDEIVNSRIKASKVLYKLLEENPNQVQQVISASAIGIYETLDRIQDEEHYNVAHNFVGKVTKLWEKENSHFNDLNINTCLIRIGLVLDRQGGALAEMEKVAENGLISILGSGKQYYSWIHIDDLVNIFVFAAERGLKGVYNAVAPTPETNRGFTDELCKVLNRNVRLPRIPSWLLRIALGEKAMLVSKGQLVSCSKLLKEDYIFQYSTLSEALNQLYDLK